jgi:hypothetical protein
MTKKSQTKSGISRRAEAMRLLLAAGFTDEAIRLGQAPAGKQSQPTLTPKAVIGDKKTPIKEPNLKGTTLSANTPEKGLTKKLGKAENAPAKKPNSRVEIIRISDCTPCEARERKYKHIIVKPEGGSRGPEGPEPRK